MPPGGPRARSLKAGLFCWDLLIGTILAAVWMVLLLFLCIWKKNKGWDTEFLVFRELVTYCHIYWCSLRQEKKWLLGMTRAHHDQLETDNSWQAGKKMALFCLEDIPNFECNFFSLQLHSPNNGCYLEYFVSNHVFKVFSSSCWFLLTTERVLASKSWIHRPEVQKKKKKSCNHGWFY